MKKRRVLSLLSILLVSLLFSPHTFSQETPGAVVRVAPRPLSPDNDLHLVDIVIENGQAVTGYQVMLQYDSDYIEYVAIDRGNYLPDDAFFGDAQVRDTDPNDPLKAILFAATAFPDQSEGDGVLATLTFETIIDEFSDLTLLDVTLLSHDVVDNTPALSSPQLKNSRTHVVKSPDIEKVVQATYSYKGVFLFREDPEPITTLEEIIRRDEWGNEHYDLDGDGDITATDLAWMTLAVRLDVNDDKKINTQDRNAVEKVFNKTGIRPEDVNGDRVVNIQDIILVTTAILAVESLSRQWSNLPVEKVVQATYSHEGVFLFREDPETAVVTLEEMVRRGESDPDYDLDGDGKITSTDLTWMRFAVRLDVNGDEKITSRDIDSITDAIGKTGNRPEDVNGDKVVSSDDHSLVKTAILAVEDLLRQWNNLPQNNVRRVVQATYSFEGVFLFREDPETAVVTLEEMVRRGESDPDYDLDGDGKITSTDLAWMRFAVRLDVNGDEKITSRDIDSITDAIGKTGNRPEDVNGDKVVSRDDHSLVKTAIWAVNIMSRPVVQVIWYHPDDVHAYTENNSNWIVNTDSMVNEILPNVKDFYLDELKPNTKAVEFNFYTIESGLTEADLVSLATTTPSPGTSAPLAVAVLNDLRPKWQARTNTVPQWRLTPELSLTNMNLTPDIYLVVVQSEAIVVSPGTPGAAYPLLDSRREHVFRFSLISTGSWGEGWMGKTSDKNKDEMAKLLAHELGHNLGLLHTFRPKRIMGYEKADKLNDNYFEELQKAWLRLHPAFNAPGRSRGKDALFSVVNLNTNSMTLEIEVTPHGIVDQSVSQFVVVNPPDTKNRFEVVEMWKGTTSGPISYDNWKSNTREILISTIDTHGHISSWGVTFPGLISAAFPAPVHVSLLPERTGLLPNYPNPFNPETWIPYQLANPADVALTIYDIQGHVVRDLDLGHQRAGMYHSRARAAYWDGRNAVGEPVASGIYFYTLKAGDFNATRKMLIRK